MRKFWIWLLSTTLQFVGIAAIGYVFADPGQHWYDLLLYIAMLLVTIPAYNWWNEYFERIFK